MKQETKADTFVAFFFLCFDQSTSLNLETVLTCLIRQTLNETNLTPDLVSELEKLSLSNFSNIEALLELLANRIMSWKKFYIIIDGLDELDNAQRRRLLSALATLPSQCDDGLRMLLTGRDNVSGEVRAAFSEMSTMSQNSQADMANFVNVLVQKRLDDRCLVVGAESLVDEIKVALTDGADGM